MNSSASILNPIGLTHDDLLDEYDKLSQLYSSLKKQSEKSSQEIFELRRGAELSEKREKYLNQELESLSEIQNKELDEEKQRHSYEADELRQRLNAAKSSFGELENELDKVKEELAGARALLESRSTECACKEKARESTAADAQTDLLEKMEQEQQTLLDELEELKRKLHEALQANSRYEIELENVKECLLCTKGNLNSKNEELEEKNQIIDTLQEKMIGLSAELEELKNGSGNKSQWCCGKSKWRIDENFPCR